MAQWEQEQGAAILFSAATLSAFLFGKGKFPEEKGKFPSARKY